MKPIAIIRLTVQVMAFAAVMLLASADPIHASTAARSSLDGQTRAEGIRQWIEIAEPSNLGLLFMGIAGLLIGRWAAMKKRKGPPEQ